MAKTVQAEDLYCLRLVSDPQMSAKGDGIVYVKTRADKKDLTYYSNLQIISIAEKSDSALTEEGVQQDRMPRMHPDGRRLIFLRIREEKQSLRSINLFGGESKKICDLPQGKIWDMRFSPDGKSIAILFAALKEDIPLEKGKRKEPVCRDISRLYYRLDGHGFIDEEAAQIYLLPSSGGKLKKITQSSFDISRFAWSPDSKRLAYVSIDQPDPELHIEEEDIFILDLEKDKLQKYEKTPGPVSMIKFSADADTLFFFGHFHPNYSWGAENMDLHSLDLKSGKIQNLSGSLDRTSDMITLGDITSSFVAQSPVICGDNLFFTISSEGANPLMQVNLKSGKIQTLLGGERCIIAYSASQDGRQLALHIAETARPDEIWHLNLADKKKKIQRLSFNNDRYIKNLHFRPAQRERIEKEDSYIDVFLQFPPDFDESKTYPLILNIHGGPRTQYGFTWFHEMQYFAAQGYLVAYSNPRGSQGYGKDFAAAITGKWAEPAYEDLMELVDNLCTRPYIDKEALFVTGGSYGGYMTNWIVSQTQRFRAAVTQRSICDLGGFFGTSDIGWDLVGEFGGTPWEVPENYSKWSPLTYLKNIKTPLMIIHSENDLRCPMEQAERLYAPLKYMGRDVRLIRFPESSHGLSRSGRPDRRIRRLELILEWFDKQGGKPENIS